MLGELDLEADLAASALSDLASSVPMQGLNVMADAADEVQPHKGALNEEIIDLVDGDVDVVTVSKADNAMMTLDALYTFNRTKELIGKLNLKQKCGLINAFLRGLEVDLVEQNLSPFQNWFDKLQFADAILKPEDLGNKFWHVRHVLLSPNCVQNVSFGRAPRVFCTCV
jgi:hypothetical protein